MRGTERTATARLPLSATSPSQARAFVEHVLHDWDAEREPVADLARLLVSELVTNAVFHAHSPIELRVRRQPSALRVEVRDDDPAPPVRQTTEPLSTTGRGIELVESLADSWGTERWRDGKVVWFELPL